MKLDRKVYDKEYRAKNRKKINAYKKEYYRKNSKIVLLYQLFWTHSSLENVKKHRERCRLNGLTHRKANRKAWLATRKAYYEKNKEVIKMHRLLLRLAFKDNKIKKLPPGKIPRS